MDAAVETLAEETSAEAVAESAVVAAAAPQLSPKVLELIQPIGSSGTGEDPRYSEHFAQIKQEIDRLSGANFEQVLKLSREVLISEGKDLRVAGYLILSTLYCKGIAELPEAITVYRMIMDKLWDGCFPTKANARVQAFNWLNSDRMDTFIQQQNGDAASLEDLQRLRNEIDLLNKIARQRMGDDVQEWTRISSWVDGFVKAKLSDKASREQEQREQAQKAAQGGQSQSSGNDGPLTESRAEQQIAKIVTFYRERGERAQSIALSRAIRWGGLLTTPPNEAGITRIPAFRVTALNELAALQSSGATPEQIFVMCENLLQEPGGQWNMDLQHVAHKSLLSLNDAASAQVLEAEIKGLLKRCTGLADLCYDGRVPFASEATKEWLNTVAAAGSSDNEGQAEITTDEDLKEIIIKASKASAGGNLVAGLVVLKELPGATGRQRFIRRVEEVRLCIKMRYTEMAAPMLEALNQEIVKADIATWEPALALAVWQLQLKQIALELPKANSTQQQELKDRIKQINAWICLADQYEAARMNRKTKEKGANNG